MDNKDNSIKQDNTATDIPQVIQPTATPLPDGVFTLAKNNTTSQLLIDQYADDYEGMQLVANMFVEDIKMVTGADMQVVIDTDADHLKGSGIIAGTTESMYIKQLASEGKINVDDIKGKWEVYKIDVVEKPFAGVDKALVIAGSDKRGTMYGLLSISEKMGVSPWVYWADVNPEEKSEVSFRYSELRTTSKEPSVKYRGIFLNDEEPALGTWVNKKFKQSTGGKFNELFYEKVFQLLLRLKGNYLWPAMWNSSFGASGYDYPEASADLANLYGIVMGTSHHEPMMLAHRDWLNNKSKYGNGEWDWVTNEEGLREFFEYGAKNFGKNDNLCTIGMRGDGDATMLPVGSSVEENVTLLKEIITAQKEILKESNLKDKPTMLALYKEVEEYWYGDDETAGLKEWDGLDDTIVLLAEDNYGNMRTLPTLENRNRAGGWGLYYHFDYNGAPASYQWTQTFQLQKVWEQMSMAYDYGVDDIWIVNVGDLKPMEMPISYFLDMAYDFEKWGTNNIESSIQYENEWLSEQFGRFVSKEDIDEMARILDDYTKITTYRKPEIVTTDTYSLENYNEAATVLAKIDSIYERAQKYQDILTDEAKMYVNIQGETKVYDSGKIDLQEFTSINNEEYTLNILNGGNNSFDYEVETDSDWIILSKENGKVETDDSFAVSVDFSKVSADSTGTITVKGNSQTVTINITANVIDITGLSEKTYVEAHDYIAIEAGNYADKAATATGAEWKEIDKYGRTVSSMKVFPTTEYFKDEYDAPYIDYKFYTDESGRYTVQTHIAPSNNVDWDYVSMKFAVSIDGQAAIYVDTIPNTYIAGTWRDSIWSNAVRNNIRMVDTELGYLDEGEHTIRIYAIDPAVVLEKMIIYPDAAKLKKSYLGPKESYYVGK